MMSVAAISLASREPPHLPSALLAAGVHLLLFVVLVFGLSWQSRLPDAVSVELWDLPPLPQAEPRAAPPPEIKREPDPARLHVRGPARAETPRGGAPAETGGDWVTVGVDEVGSSG